MYYVYLLRSLNNSNKTYVGFTTNLKERVQKHNEGGSWYTKEDKPWKLVMYLAFEKYIKIGSGHAFAKKILW